MRQNLILKTDSYKPSMFVQYPPGTTKVYSYIESRGGKYPRTVFLGLQPLLREYFANPITQEDIEEAAEFFAAHGEPFNREGWEYILKVYKGFLPLKIKSVDEGTVVETRNVLVTVENTDPQCFWLTTYVETMILRAIWYATTVATNSYTSKQVIKQFLEETGDPAGIDFKLHDFGARGVSSGESATLGGLAHLVNFKGSDTIEGILGAREYYDEPMAGFSIPAMEHSTVTAWGRDHEVDAYRNMLKQFGKPGALLACVSDSYDIEKAVSNLWGEELKDEVIKSGAVVVIRPDSGNPAMVVTDVVRRLDVAYGSTTNSKGYKVLNNVRVIQGDGINTETIRAILLSLKWAGYSADNVAFGQGGALLQQLDRDTCQFAMKCSYIEQGLGNGRFVFKHPKHDSSKNSKLGRLALVKRTDGSYVTLEKMNTDKFASADRLVDELKVRFENGFLLNQTTFTDVRKRANER